MAPRRKRKPTSQAAPKKMPIKEEPIDYGEGPPRASKRQRTKGSPAPSLPVKIKIENESPVGRSRKKPLAPIKISPPGASPDDGGLKMKFILSPKREPSDEDDDDDDDDDDDELEEEEEALPGSSSTRGLKMKISYRNEEKAQGRGQSSKKKAPSKHAIDSYVHPKKRFKTTFEESLNMADESVPNSLSSRRGKKFDSDSGYSDTAAGRKIKSEESLNLETTTKPVVVPADKRKDKKKKRKEKDKKKKLFKNKSDKNRFLNVHRSSDEGGGIVEEAATGGWIEDKEQASRVVREDSIDSNEYEVVATWSKPGEEDLGEGSNEVEIPLAPIKLKKDKKKSKHHKNKHRHEKKRRRSSFHESGLLAMKKKEDKESFTQEQIVRIQQRLMLQGLKSPSSGGEDPLGGLNFSSHGEDLISQLTASSGHFDPSSLLVDDLPPEEPTALMKPILVKKGADAKGKQLAKQKQRKKKVPTAYQMWCKANRASILKVNPGLSFAAMSRKLGELWMALPEKEKTKWKHKQRALLLRHKNVPALSRMKGQKLKPGNAKARSQQYKAPPPHTDPVDVAAHLKLLGDSLLNVGQNLMTQAGAATEVHGSMSVLMDSMLSAIAPLVCLTSEVPELDFIPKKQQSSLLENIAYIMPGL